ncbi:MATE family efflux transporter [Pseudoalteromonas arctica]|uniref:MATE family efflux transporter n=1 Tax=Pseudoalteromonas arctica TaxID=394751 RepID=A0A7Y0DQ49_9GAMM|nr:MATE family efflux transporter [Pseudoalteromonas arctica]NMM39597.1 MATE family efflux transporter [Pseudoalteromonas arctica]
MPLISTIYRPLLALALPLIFIQLCQASLGLIDTMIAGQFHYNDLSGVGLGSSMWTPVFIFFTGIMYVLVPKTSELVASHKRGEIYRLFLQGKKAAFWLAIVGFLLVQLLAFLAPWMIADAAVATICKNYLHCVAFAMPSLVYTLLYRFISEGDSTLLPIVKTVIFLLVINTLLNLVLVFGVAGMAGLGGAGCGVATAISAYIAFLMMRNWVQKSVPEISQKAPLKSCDNDAKKILKDGFPIGVALVVEVLALTTLAFFASSLGVKQVAAHQIAINIAMVAFMIPLALSSATTIRIASLPNAADYLSRRLTAKAAISLAFLYGVIAALVIMTFGQLILHAFSHDEKVLMLASGLLLYIALFQLFDAIQIVAAGILRGLQEFMSPLLVILVVYWFAVVPFSYFVVNYGWWGGSAGVDNIWLLLSTGLALAALVLSINSFRIVNKKVDLFVASEA